MSEEKTQESEPGFGAVPMGDSNTVVATTEENSAQAPANTTQAPPELPPAAHAPAAIPSAPKAQAKAKKNTTGAPDGMIRAQPAIVAPVVVEDSREERKKVLRIVLVRARNKPRCSIGFKAAGFEYSLELKWGEGDLDISQRNDVELDRLVRDLQAQGFVLDTGAALSVRSTADGGDGDVVFLLVPEFSIENAGRLNQAMEVSDGDHMIKLQPNNGRVAVRGEAIATFLVENGFFRVN